MKHESKFPLTTSHTHTNTHTLKACYALTMTASFFMLFDSFLLFSRYHGYLWTSGDLLKPSPPTQIHSPGAPLHSGKMLPNDLDSSLANLVGSEYKMCKFSLHFSLLTSLAVSPFQLMLCLFLFYFFSQTCSLGGRQLKSEWVCLTSKAEPQADDCCRLSHAVQ